MTFKTDILEDMAEVLDDTDEFTDVATYTTAGGAATIINGKLDSSFFAIQDLINTESSKPVFICMTSDVSTAPHDDTLVVDSITYKIKGYQPDETGMTILILERQ